MLDADKKPEEALAEQVRAVLQPWRALTIGIDGRDGSGKSTLARYLALHCELPAVEADLVVIRGVVPPTYDARLLGKLLKAGLSRNKPVIVEGIFLLQTLAAASIRPDFLIYIDAGPEGGSYTWRAYFEAYEREYSPRSRADVVFRSRAWGASPDEGTT